MTKFETEMTEIVRVAVKNPENLYDYGSVSWSYVDADTYMEMNAKYPKMENFDEVYYSLFDDVCTRVENEMVA